MPNGFGVDQYKYFNISQDIASYNSQKLFSFNYFKVEIMSWLSYPLRLFFNDLLYIRIVNILLFSSLLVYLINTKLNNENLATFIIFPSIILYPTLFIRETYLIIFILLYFNFFNKIKFNFYDVIFLLISATLRLEFTIAIFPYFLNKIFKYKNLYVFNFIYLLLIFYLFIFNDVFQENLENYRQLFNFSELDKFNFILNFIFPTNQASIRSQSLYEIAFLFSFVEFLVILFLISKSQPTALLIFLIAAIEVGSISSNIGFVTRLRSPIIFFILILYLINSNNYAKK